MYVIFFWNFLCMLHKTIPFLIYSVKYIFAIDENWRKRFFFRKKNEKLFCNYNFHSKKRLEIHALHRMDLHESFFLYLWCIEDENFLSNLCFYSFISILYRSCKSNSDWMECWEIFLCAVIFVRWSPHASR